MKQRNGFVSNSSTSSFIITPKPEFRKKILSILKEYEQKDEAWMGVWHKEIGTTIIGGESSIFAAHDTWLEHPEWFNAGQLEQDEWNVVWKLYEKKWINKVIKWDEIQ